MTTLPDLDRLYAEATPTPWSGNRKYIVAMHVPRTIALFPSGGGSYHGTKDPVQATRDRVLVEELVNAYPALRAYVAALEEADRASRFILYGVVVTAGSETYLTKGDPVTCYRRLSEARLATDAAREKMEKQDG